MIITNPGTGMLTLIALFLLAVGWEFWRGEG